MRTNRYTLGLIAVLVAGALLLSGCVTIRSEATINSDLSGTRTIILAMDKSMMDLANSANAGTPSPDATPSDPFADVKKSAEKIPGAQVEPYTDEKTGRTGVKMTVPFKDLNEFATQNLSDEGESSKDKVEWTQDGDVVTLNIGLSVESVSSKASGSEPSSTPQTPQEKAMAQQMLAAMGLEYSYALALPGEIVDYSPKDTATFDADKNEITWTIDFAKATTESPQIMVKWDNSKAPSGVLPEGAAEPKAAPTKAAAPKLPAKPKATPQAMVEPVEPSTAGQGIMAALQTYADAVMNQDQDAYNGLMAGDVINHPLVDQFPDLFGMDVSVVYTTLTANENTGMAEWNAQWTLNDQTVGLSGVDVITFDESGKITAIKAFVEPSEWDTVRGK